MNEKPSLHPYVLALFLVAIGLAALVQHIAFVLGMVALAAILAALLAVLGWAVFVAVRYARRS